MSEPMDERTLIESTVAGLEARMAELRRRKDRHAERYETQIADVVRLIQTWNARLAALAETPLSPALTQTRRRRGQNKNEIRAYMASRDYEPALIGEIADGAGLPRSSVRVTLTRNPQEFMETAGGRWTHVEHFPFARPTPAARLVG